MRGYIRKRAKQKNSWSVTVDLGKDPSTGKRKQKYFTVEGSRKDAEKFLTKVLRDLDTGRYVDPAKMTTGEFLKTWIENHGINVKTTTKENYESIIKTHLIPELGNIPLSKLSPIHIQSLYAKKLQKGRADGKDGGLSTRMVRYMHSLLVESLNYAVSIKLIPENPAKSVKPVRVSQKEMTCLTPEQVKAFLEAAKSDRFFPLFVCALGTGLRRGELLGLKWQDVDLDKGTVTVRRTLARTKDGLVLQEPKSQASCRTVVLPEEVVKILKALKIEQAKQKLKAGPLYQDNGLVFATSIGTPLNPENITKRHLYPVLEKAGLPRIRFHDLRHTHATLLLLKGENFKVVSERLGHSSVAFTLKTYAHVLPGMQEGAAKRINAVLETGSKT
ncbi:MAG: tyrosine-type recombinase/integrase [Desulfofundulus sp.]